MAFKLNSTSLYVKGTADIWVKDIETRDVIGYSNKIDTSSITSSANNGEIRAGLLAPVVLNIPDSAIFTGEITAADFSMTARQLQTGGVMKYNGTVMVQEQITATTTTLTVTHTPVPDYGEPSSNKYYTCYVGTDGVNYGVDPETKAVQGFTATIGEKYCVKYFYEVASAQELAIPTAFAPVVASVTVKMAVYAAQGNSASNSSRVGYLYIHIPRAQFIDGDAGVNGSQTENANTSWKFSALAYDEADVTCAECAADNSVLGYMVYVPCDSSTASIEALVSVGVVSIAAGETAQAPVQYLMADNSLVTPDYSDLTFTSADATVATVSTAGVITAGVITGVAAGTTTIKVSVTSDTTLTTTVSVTVTE